ncbi:MAG: acyl-CoA dehydrogenase family protein, partial [Solirubrobacterales bacterium]
RVDFVDALRTFTARVVGTPEQRAALTDDHELTHSDGLYRRLGELGYLSVGFPEEHGGGGGTILDTCLLVEELFYAKTPVAGLSTTMTVGHAVERHADDELRDDVLRSIARGDTHALGFSEPEAGSDLANLRCRAVRADGGWVVSGQKTWTTNAHFADYVLLMVRTGEQDSRHEGITMLSVPMDSPGIEVRGIDTLGGREVNDVFLTDVFVPDERLVGAEGQGWRQLMAGLNGERLLIGAVYLGHARRAFDDGLAYVKERRQFGRPIGSFQALRHRFADLATELACCRLMVYDLARRTEAEPEKTLPREASMVKLKVTETAKHVALECMQSMGGYGFASEYGMEQHVRATLPATIFGGANEVQRDIIGKTYGL